MNEAVNVQAVRDFFQAFKNGDLGAIERLTTPDVEWLVVGTHTSETVAALPWVGLHKGRDAVNKFFAALVSSIEVITFDPQDYIAQGDAVAVFGYFKYRAVSTKKLMETDWAIKIRLRDGKIARYHFFEDTYAIAAAFRHSGSWEIENGGKRRQVP